MSYTINATVFPLVRENGSVRIADKASMTFTSVAAFDFQVEQRVTGSAEGYREVFAAAFPSEETVLAVSRDARGMITSARVSLVVKDGSGVKFHTLKDWRVSLDAEDCGFEETV